jgi:hypothetical protein
MMIELTLEEAFELAKSFVEPNPDFIYKDEEGKSGVGANCHYIHGADTDLEKPGCIVGTMFDALGVERSDLIRCDDLSRTASQVLSSLELRGMVQLLGPVGEFLDALQVHQDRGHNWGNALRDAARRVGIDYQG